MQRLPTRRPESAPDKAISALDRAVVRSLAENISEKHRLDFARSFAFAAVHAYCNALGVRTSSTVIPNCLSQAILSPEATRAAEELGLALRTMPKADAVYFFGCIYTSALPEEFRASHGIFYTPPTAVRYTLDMAERAGVDFSRARCLDPSAGGGAFIVELITRLRKALDGTEPTLILSQIAARIRGYDLDPFGAWLAQTAAHIAVNDLELFTGRPLPPIVAVRDSLDMQTVEEGAFDLVCSNVPFGKVRLSPARRAEYANSTYGHANLYALFTEAGVRYAKRKGVVAYIIPTSMLSGLYFRALRAFLATDAPPFEVTFISQRSGVFEDALQETMLVTFRRGHENRTGKVCFAAIENECATPAAGAFALPNDPHAPWLLPRDAAQTPLVTTLRGMKHRLGAYGYSVSTGPLVWNRFKTQLHGSPTVGALPIIWAEAVSSDGCFIWRAQRRNHAPWFAPKLPKDKWLIVNHGCVLLQRTTAKEQSRRLIAAELPEDFVSRHGGVVVENHLNMIRAKTGRPTISLSVIAAVLNSKAVDAAFRCINGSVAVSAFELEELPLPPPAIMHKVGALLEIGASAAKIERVIAEAYGLL